MTNRAYSVLTVKRAASDDDDKYKFVGTATTPQPDREGDIVEPSGAKFSLPIPLLLHHDHRLPVGFVDSATVSADGIKFTASLAKIKEPGALRDRVEEARQSIEAGLIRGVSIGFIPDDMERAEAGYRFKTWEWLELSLVTVPANAEATLETVKSLDKKVLAASGPEKPLARVKTAATGTKRNAIERIKHMAKKSLAEQIAAFADTRQEKTARMAEIVAGSEGETFDAAAQEEFDALEADIEQIDAHVKRLRSVEKAQRDTARPVDAGSETKATESRSGVIHARAKSAPAAPGIRFARYVKAMGVAHKTHRPVDAVAESMFGSSDPDLVAFTKAAVGAHDTVNQSALIGNDGGFADFVEFLRPMTILGKFGLNGIPALRQIPFRVPLISQTTGTTGYWVGEGASKPLTSMGTARTELAPTKVANIAVATMELLRDSTPSAERALRDDMAAALIVRMDTSFIDPANAGTANIVPASITNGISGTATAGTDAAGARTDARAAMGAFVAADNSLNEGVWIMSGSNALALTLMQNALGQAEFPGMTVNGGVWFGLPVVVSNHAGTNITLMRASDVWFADEGGIDVAISSEATLEMESAPTATSTNDAVTGAPVAATGAMVSMFQTNSLAFRAERTVNWARRRDAGVSLITGAAYVG